MPDVLIEFCASYSIGLVGLVAVIAFFRLEKSKRWQYAALLAGASLIAFILQLLAARLHYEPRPFVLEHIRPLVPHGTDNGFPSDHALATMTLALATYLYNRKLAGLMFVGVALTAMGRVLAHLHSPQQIGAGWAIAIVAVLAVHGLQQTWIRRRGKTA